jgi:hypothetical protein
MTREHFPDAIELSGTGAAFIRPTDMVDDSSKHARGVMQCEWQHGRADEVVHELKHVPRLSSARAALPLDPWRWEAGV